MQKFNLMIIGDANHQYIQNFSKWLRTVIPTVSITIVSFHPIKNKKNARTYFNQYFEVPPNSKISAKIKGFRTISLAWKACRLLKKHNLRSDVLLVHYVAPQLAYIGHFLKKRTSNYIMALWGSDFYRATPKVFLKTNIKYANNIIIGTPQMVEDFKTKFENQMPKVHLCYFGNEPIENLKEIKESNITKQESCSFFDLSDNKINVTIGHNGSKTHQHISILNELSRLPSYISKRIRILLPMTYGLDDEYLKEIRSICAACSFEHKIFTEFMNDYEVAHLRNLTDIMLNLQTSDAFSGSMREVLYCGGVVISGSWLPYQFLKEIDVYFEEVNSIKEIPGKLSEIVLNYSSLKDKCKNNSSKIFNVSSWSQTIHKWKEVIELQL